jgi:hypothetical protein
LIRVDQLNLFARIKQVGVAVLEGQLFCIPVVDSDVKVVKTLVVVFISNLQDVSHHFLALGATF